jgi:hypothetical protein
MFAAVHASLVTAMVPNPFTMHIASCDIRANCAGLPRQAKGGWTIRVNSFHTSK